MLLRTLPLLTMIALGVLAGGVRLFPDPRAAIGVLNRFALYLAFPLLIVASLASDDLQLPDGAGFYVVHGVALVVQLALAMGVSRGFHRERGAVATSAIFGNIAYLGIPYCTAVLGPASTGLAALSAAIHIVFGMCLAPILLLGGGSSHRVDWKRVAQRVAAQPLVWAPFVGLALRWAPPVVVERTVALVSPVGSAAGPVALFMLGLYLHAERGRIGRGGAPTLAATGLKLVLYPAVTSGAILVLGGVLPMDPVAARVAVLVSAMPVAITTFALAHEFEAGEETVAQTIVLSTLVALGTLPLLTRGLAWL